MSASIRFEPGTAGWDAGALPLCYAIPAIRSYIHLINQLVGRMFICQFKCQVQTLPTLMSGRDCRASASTPSSSSAAMRSSPTSFSLDWSRWRRSSRCPLSASSWVFIGSSAAQIGLGSDLPIAVSSLNSFALESKICEQGRLFYDQPLTEKVKSKVKFFCHQYKWNWNWIEKWNRWKSGTNRTRHQSSDESEAIKRGHETKATVKAKQNEWMNEWKQKRSERKHALQQNYNLCQHQQSRLLSSLIKGFYLDLFNTSLYCIL